MQLVFNQHRRSQWYMRAIPTHVLTIRGLCLRVGHEWASQKRINHSIFRSGGADLHELEEPCRPIRWTYTVAPLGENDGSMYAATAVVKVVMCSRGGSASEVETHKNIDSLLHTKTRLHFKLTVDLWWKLHKKLPVENGSKLGDVCNNFYRSTNC